MCQWPCSQDLRELGADPAAVAIQELFEPTNIRSLKHFFLPINLIKGSSLCIKPAALHIPHLFFYGAPEYFYGNMELIVEI